MTTYLFSLLTTGADRMAQSDPHGLTLTFVSVSVVFAALLILFGIYTVLGNFFSGKYKRRNESSKDAESVKEAGVGKETEVAIATALHLYLSECAHEDEPGFITIRSGRSDWSDKSFTFRKAVKK